MKTPEAVSKARDEAIERGVLWVLRDLWLQGPLPLPALERMVADHNLSRRDAKQRIARCFRRSFLVSIETDAGDLVTLGSRGRLALGLDSAHRSQPETLELAFARRAAASVILKGASVALRASIGERGEGAQFQARGEPQQDPRHLGQRGLARLYEDQAGEQTWLLVGVPSPTGQTVRRLVERAAGQVVVVVTDERRAVVGPVPPSHVWPWAAVLQDMAFNLRAPLEGLLAAKRA